MEAAKQDEKQVELVFDFKVGKNDSKGAKYLCEAREYSQRKMKPFLQFRLQALNEHVGDRFGESSQGLGPKSKSRRPMNLLNMTEAIYDEHLGTFMPQCGVGCSRLDLMPLAWTLENDVNQTLRAMDLQRVFKRAMPEAFYGLCMVKVGVDGMPELQTGGYGARRELFPYAEVIDLSDAVLDMSAASLDTMQFAGHKYDLPVKLALEGDYFDEDAKKILRGLRLGKDGVAGPSDPSVDNRNADTNSSRLGNTDSPSARMHFEDVFTVWEMWLPHYRKVVTLLADTETVLKVVDWEGPACGPYLYFAMGGEVPNNVMKVSPAMLLFDLHETTNRMFTKGVREEEALKRIVFYKPQAEKEAEQVKDTNDNGMVKSEDPSAFNQVKFGGMEQATFAMLQMLQTNYNLMAGNIYTIGGLSAQAQTLGQEEILQTNSSKKIADMVFRFKLFLKELVNSVAHYVWHDPAGINTGGLPPVQLYADLGVRMENLRSVRDQYGAGEGEYWEHGLIIEPEAVMELSPQQKLQIIDKEFGKFMQAAPLYQQQGVGFDIPAMLHEISRLTNYQGLERLITFQSPPKNAEVGQQQEGGYKPANTKREYVRRNVPGTSPEQQMNAMAQLMAGQNMQPKEANTIGKM